MNRALVVGIGNYGRLGQPLPGCANDLAGWRDRVSATVAIGDGDLRVRADAQATRDALLADFRWLLADASDGDQRIFFFAGHGARLRRRDPISGTVDTVLSETLVTYPAASDDRETYMLFDRDLAELIDESAMPATARLTMIIDACHSGGMARAGIGGEADDDGPLVRCMVFAEDEDKALARDLDAPKVRPFGIEISEALARAFDLHGPPASRVIVAAASAEQKAWDDRMPNGKRHGIFSYYALQAIAAQPSISFNALIAIVTPPILLEFPQQPVLLGDTGRFAGQIFN
jgi:hypothetical protein